MQVCTSLQTDNHASTQPLSLPQARCPSCHPTNSIKALKATASETKNELPSIEDEGQTKRITILTKRSLTILTLICDPDCQF